MKIKYWIWPVIILILIMLTYLLYDQANMIHQTAALIPPTWSHWLGTDHLGRDFLTRLFVGSMVTLGLTSFILIGTVILGLILGLLSAMIGHWFDSIMMALADMLIALPAIIIALVVLGFMNNSILGLCFALIIGWLGRYLRYFRNLARDAQKQPFVKYAPLSGLSKLEITIYHIVPHLLSNVMALVTADFGKLMLSISGLAFIGLGVKPPLPELGAILYDGKSYFYSAPWLFFFPGVLLGGFALICQYLNRRFIH
ncbi:ABC transporter permease [Staphylococcus lugdunensis]|jgi:peptide/nickel transport system permease protein|uniref:ABC transporter permease n=1 Tax=Staphylococcus lugdunensis TaxID=28035 RepID=UPI00045B3331|nr:ABC transporter permease [Staphylococcus lugdunensis]KAK56130.1 ABC transporter, permease protein [Staphylococcus lugdunensis VCU150]MCI2845241.1 ABC transporter permease [Staphylococcus lugdunensis]MDU4770115.1 ABC transporter permease [Staphylococcus lugdunensis]